jgi:hypothetical protein
MRVPRKNRAANNSLRRRNLPRADQDAGEAGDSDLVRRGWFTQMTVTLLRAAQASTSAIFCSSTACGVDQPGMLEHPVSVSVPNNVHPSSAFERNFIFASIE